MGGVSASSLNDLMEADNGLQPPLVLGSEKPSLGPLHPVFFQPVKPAADADADNAASRITLDCMINDDAEQGTTCLGSGYDDVR